MCHNDSGDNCEIKVFVVSKETEEKFAREVEVTLFGPERRHANELTRCYAT